MAGVMPPTSYMIIDDNLIISRGDTELEAVLNCPKIKIDIREEGDSLKYYLIMPSYYKTKERLICTTAKDVKITRALEHGEIYDILSYLELGSARVIK